MSCNYCQEVGMVDLVVNGLFLHMDPVRRGGYHACKDKTNLTDCKRCRDGELLDFDNKGSLLHVTDFMNFECHAKPAEPAAVKDYSYEEYKKEFSVQTLLGNNVKPPKQTLPFGPEGQTAKPLRGRPKKVNNE
jgi:hypothetical protein